MSDFIPVGKLPAGMLARILAQAPISDERVVLRPGVGVDCAVVDVGTTLLVFKSDPITFATDEIGWYLVQVNVNDIATTGALPRWLLVTLLLPEGQTTPQSVEAITQQVYRACREMDISVVGGHTEITHGLTRPVVVGTLVGEVAHERLVTPKGASPGDRILLTKGVPIETTAILAREFPDRLRQVLGEEAVQQAADYLTEPGISVLRDAQVALASGRVTAMHDPTEGGLKTALWELAEASGRTLVVDLERVHVPDLSARVCEAFGLDPLASIASGALLLTSPGLEAGAIREGLQEAGVVCTDIGFVEAGPATVWRQTPQRREKAAPAGAGRDR